MWLLFFVADRQLVSVSHLGSVRVFNGPSDKQSLEWRTGQARQSVYPVCNLILVGPCFCRIYFSPSPASLFVCIWVRWPILAVHYIVFFCCIKSCHTPWKFSVRSLTSLCDKFCALVMIFAGHHCTQTSGCFTVLRRTETGVIQWHKKCIFAFYLICWII